MLSKHGMVSVLLALAAFYSIGYWWRLGEPVALADAETDRLSCVSYAPFHKAGQTPLDRDLVISEAQMLTDLTALAQRFACVRTYSVSQGLQDVPRLARQLGMQVLLGVWIGRDHADNEKELAVGAELARQYPEVVRAVIVGNEVLLRREQTPAGMQNYLREIQAAAPGVPVSYADSWDFWLRYRNELSDAVSFATVHILPFWDDDTVAVADAAAYVNRTYRRIKAELHDKEVLVGETGWPSYGRQRQDAESSLINQARFIREFAAVAKAENIPYNIIEAFDQPWKRQSEGAVGGYWGMFGADGAPKFPFNGAVAEAPEWRFAAFAAMLAFFGLFALDQWRQRQLNKISGTAALAMAICAGGGWVAYLRDMAMTNRSALEWLYTGFYALALFAAAFLLGNYLSVWLAKKRTPPAFVAAGDLLNWRLDRSAFEARLAGALRLVFLFGAAIVCLLLVFDLRNRDYPLALFAFPALALALLAWIKGKSDARLEEVVLAGWISFSGLLLPVIEHLIFAPDMSCRFADGLNPDALYWSALCQVLAGSVLVPAFFEFRARQRQKA